MTWPVQISPVFSGEWKSWTAHCELCDVQADVGAALARAPLFPYRKPTEAIQFVVAEDRCLMALGYANMSLRFSG